MSDFNQFESETDEAVRNLMLNMDGEIEDLSMSEMIDRMHEGMNDWPYAPTNLPDPSDSLLISNEASIIEPTQELATPIMSEANIEIPEEPPLGSSSVLNTPHFVDYLADFNQDEAADEFPSALEPAETEEEALLKIGPMRPMII